MQWLLPPPLPRRSGGGLSPSLLAVVSILATRFNSTEAGLAKLSLPYDSTNRVTATTLSSDGNLLVSGCALSTMERSVAGHSALNAVAFVAKYAQTGEQLWRRELTSAQGEDGEQGDCSSVFIATDANANVFLAGTTVVTSVSVSDAPGGSKEDASDMFVAKMTASGNLLWRKTLGTAQRDEATAISVDPSGSAVYVTGFSGGDTTQQKSSSSISDCVQWRSTTSSTNQAPVLSATAQECLAGIVLKLETRAGELQWVHRVVSQTADRVFSVDVDSNGSIVIVGDTKGDLQRSQGDSAPVPHAGDLFVRKLDKLTGEALWTTQLGGGGLTADLCRLPVEGPAPSVKRRGNCGIALVPSSSPSSESSVYFTGTTSGLVSTLEQDIRQYAALCNSSNHTKQKPKTRFFEIPDATADANDCAHQAMLVKLWIGDGRVEWIHQVVSTARTSAEGLARVPGASSSGGFGDSDNVVVLGLADPGFMSSSELKQLFVLRATVTGETQWLQETGLSGEDHAFGIASATAIASESLLLVMGVGNRETSRIANENDVLGTAYARKLNPLTGHLLPFCEDGFAFQTNATSVQQLTRERVVVFVTVERYNERCGADSSITYAIEASELSDVAAARPGVDFVASKGLVHFAALQKSVTVAVLDVLPAASEPSYGNEELVRSLTLVLERVTGAQSESVGGVLRAPFRMSIAIKLATISTTTGTNQFPSINGDNETAHEGAEAADGHFWRWLSRICALAIGLALVLTVALGWLCGNVCGYTCLRKAKVFQYKRIKSPRASSHAAAAGLRGGLDEPSLKRKSSSQSFSGALELSRSRSPRPGASNRASEFEMESEEEDEDEELREHLHEIQQLNDSLEALLNSNASGTQRRRGASANDDDSSAVDLQAKPSTSPGVVTPILSTPVGPLTALALSNSSNRRSKARKKVRNVSLSQ